MSNIKIRALMGASALVMAAGAAQAQTQTVTQVYGGGSSLSAPYVRQAEDCFGLQTPLYVKGADATPSLPESYSNGATAVNCATTQIDSTVQFNHESSSSGSGIFAYYDHLASQQGGTVETLTGGVPAFGGNFPTFNYATSDTPLDEAAVTIYNQGGAALSSADSGKAVNVAAPGATPTTGQFANPAATYGAMVQIPLLITPITLAYSPVYAIKGNADGSTSSYKFTVTNTKNTLVGPTGSAPIELSTDAYCKIFNGQITNWNDPEISQLNGKATVTSVKNGKVTTKVTTYATLADPTDPNAANFSVPIELVGRSDSSGTTSLFTRALAATCATTAGNQYADSTTTLPSSLIGPTAGGTPVVGKFTVASGSGGVAGYLAFTATPASGVTVTQGRIGYLSPDYVNPVTSQYGLTYAALQNGTRYYLPTAANALRAFGTLTPPTGAAAADPAQWVQAPSKSAALAAPSTGYPIVGTTQILAYTCYADATADSTANVGYKMNRFLDFYFTNTIVTSNGTKESEGILETFGFAPMPAAWSKAIVATFVTPSATSTSASTYVSTKSDITTSTTSPTTHKTTTKTTFYHNKACDSVVGG